jgi:hypothetical protein
VTTTLVCLAAAALHANEVIDFWREEWARTHRPSAAPAPQRPRNATSPNNTGRTKVTVWPKRKKASRREDAKAETRHAGDGLYCVRTCDGFYFPANAGSSSVENSKTCSALCPGAETEPYRIGKSDGIENALSSKGKTYASLPAAFSYRTQLKAGCACKAPSKTGFAAFLDDATLVPRDIVVTERGILVFVGGDKLPHKESDFVPYREVLGLERKVVVYLDSINRLISPTNEPQHSSEAPGKVTAPMRSSEARPRNADADMASGSTDAPDRAGRKRLTAAQEPVTVENTD